MIKPILLSLYFSLSPPFTLGSALLLYWPTEVTKGTKAAEVCRHQTFFPELAGQRRSGLLPPRVTS